MIDYTQKEGEEKKKSGCLTVFIGLIVLLVLIGLGAYFYLPKAAPSLISDGALSRLLPEEIQEQTKELDRALRENMDQLWNKGITPDQALELLDQIDYKQAEMIMDEISTRSPSNTSELIDLVSEQIDLSHLDLNTLKREYDMDFSPESLKEGIEQFRQNPLFAQAGFRMVKETLKNIIEEETRDYTDMTEPETVSEPETEPEKPSSTTKKKK